MRASGGNSGHALFAIDEPNDDATERLMKRVYAVLAARFSDAAVTIDTTVSNAARIWTLYGTLKTEGRQHNGAATSAGVDRVQA